MARKTIRILIAVDHPVVRLGVRNLLNGNQFNVVGEAADGQRAVELTRQLHPDILVLDLAMPRLSGLKVLRELAKTRPAIHIILLTTKIERPQLLQLGARGILLKDSAPNDLVKAVHAVAAGQYWMGHSAVASLAEAINLLNEQAAPDPRKTFGLTPRELQIVAAVVEARTNKDIGERFSISEDTVKRHLTNIFNKLGIANRLELALFALNHGLSTTR
jgi:two-component system, NarL family, nitrate/nitrite response regulator NarL